MLDEESLMSASLAERLLFIQISLSVPKGRKNSYGGYKYRSAEDIMQAVKPLLKKTNTLLVMDDEIVVNERGVYVKSVAKLHDGKNPEKMIAVPGYAREPVAKKGMDDAQVTGSTTSYARKYALCGMFLIDDGIDSDALPPDTGKTTPPDYGICPCGKAKGKRFAELPTETLENILATDPAKVPAVTDGHREAIQAILIDRETAAQE